MTDEITVPIIYELRQMGIKYMILTRIYLRQRQKEIRFIVEGFNDTLIEFKVNDYYQLCRDVEFVLLYELPVTITEIRDFLGNLKKNKDLIINGIKELQDQ